VVVEVRDFGLFTLHVVKANGVRRAAREKADQLKELNQLIDNKLLELENFVI